MGHTWPSFFTPLEIEAKTKLPVSHNRVGRKTEDAARVAAINTAVRVPQVDVVEKVKSLRSKLTGQRLG